MVEVVNFLIFFLSLFVLNAYVIGWRPRFDLWTIGTIGLSLYGVGYLLEVVPPLPGGHAPSFVPVALEYYIYACATISVFFGVLLFDSLFNRRLNDNGVNLGGKRFSLKFSDSSVAYILLFWFFLFFVVLIKSGDALFLLPKSILMKEAGFCLVLFVNWTSVAIATSLSTRSRGSLIIFVLITAVTIVSGFRSPVAIGVMAAFVISMNAYVESSSFRFFRRYWRPLLIIGLPVGVFAVGLAKPLYTYIKAGDVGGFATIVRNNGLLNVAARGFEFLYTPHILHRVILSGYHVPQELLGPQFFSFLPFPLSFIGSGSNGISHAMQETLFPTVSWGMAGNPWAEAWAVGQWVGVFAYALGFAFGIFFLEFFRRRSRTRFWSVIITVLGVYWCFYWQRNSVPVTFGFFRNIFYPAAAIWMMRFYMRSMVREYDSKTAP